LACALAFVLWVDHVRIQRVKLVSNLAAEDQRIDASTPSGYADGKRWLIVPEHNNPTYQWIEETQLMLARGDWRVREVDYENAPDGREVHAAAPYRWWLAALGWTDHQLTGRPLAVAIEQAALYADPLIQLLLLAGGAAFVAWRFGAFAAVLFTAGLVTVFPLAGNFLPGVANDFSLSQVSAILSLLLLSVGITSPRNARPWFVAAGVAGGCGLWLSALCEAPLIAAVALGAILAAVLGRGTQAPSAERGPLPWRHWALGGALSSLLFYLVEYFPSHMDLQLRVNYPLYGVAWLGAGELICLFGLWMQSGRCPRDAKSIGIWVMALAAVAALPVAIFKSGDAAFLSGDLLASRLTNLPDGTVANSLAAWKSRDGVAGPLAATLLPLVLLLPAVWLLVRRSTAPMFRTALAVTLLPCLVAFLLATRQLRTFNTFDAALLVVVVTGAGAAEPPGAGALRLLWLGLFLPVAAFGLVQLAPPHNGTPNGFSFTRSEVEGLYERALAHWISDRAGPDGATVLVPPFRTSAFCFYGGLRGLGTQNWENREGLSAIFRIVNSTRPEETEALIAQRGVNFIVVPSWDTDLDDFARMGLRQPTDSFIYALHQTDGGIFNWLRALPYIQPTVAGFKEQAVLVLQVTDETDPATLRSRLVEYLVEMHQLDQAAFAGRALQKYPADLGALVAIAQVQKARGDSDGFDKAFAAVVSNLASGSDRALPWDRRVSLAVVLALGGRNDLARTQVERCLSEVNADHLRFLSTGSLYHLLVLTNGYGLRLDDPGLRDLAMKLLPGELRERL